MAEQAFRELLQRPEVLSTQICNHRLEVCEKRGDTAGGRQVAFVMQKHGIVENYHTFNFLIGCFGRGGDLEGMQKVYDRMRESTSKPDLHVMTNMIYYYGRARKIEGSIEESASHPDSLLLQRRCGCTTIWWRRKCIQTSGSIRFSFMCAKLMH
jgi:pentatricopeptide repeat protein